MYTYSINNIYREMAAHLLYEREALRPGDHACDEEAEQQRLAKLGRHEAARSGGADLYIMNHFV